ncbi:hypothetical protein HK096_004594 [Nowakowskiella sp. JEL0078]|nr:hypothetical protein HK096_004594 [Nowakowskiella sp. JEL0078]
MPTFVVSGQDGAGGTGGIDYRLCKAQVNYHGRDGGAATRAFSGQPAGSVSLEIILPENILIELAKIPVAPMRSPIDYLELDFQGSVVDPTQVVVEMKGPLPIPPDEDLIFVAKGGEGGAGGHGGYGEEGGDGQNGIDATRWSSGTNGSPGGNGGTGGNSSSGGHGGAGGSVRLTLKSDQTFLFCLIPTPNCNGGKGGIRGISGLGGKSGVGGIGGSEYSWYETRVYYVGSTRYTEQVLHTNPGGTNGPDGIPGLEGATSSTGTDGVNGECQFTLKDGKNHSKHVIGAPWDLRCGTVEFHSAKCDGIFEPGTRVFVSSFHFANIGEIPTPSNANILIFIDPDEKPSSTSSSLIVSEGLERFIVLPQSIGPGLSTKTQGAIITPTGIPPPFKPPSGALDSEGHYLAFSVADIDPIAYQLQNPDPLKREDPCVMQGRVVLQAQLHPLGRNLKTFPAVNTFIIQFPAQAEEIAAHTVVAENGSSKFSITISNISSLAIGRNALPSREFGVRLAIKSGEIPFGKIFFLSSLGPGKYGSPIPISSEGVYLPITNLPASGVINLEGALQFSPDIRPYSQTTISATLSLDRVNMPGNSRAIQCRTHQIRCGKSYLYDPAALFLLVTNSSTTLEEFSSWENVIRSTLPLGGVPPCVWDVSVNGNFNLATQVHPGGTLFDHWRGKTIIMLCNPFFTGGKVSPESGSPVERIFEDILECTLLCLDLDHEQLQIAISIFKIRFLALVPTSNTGVTIGRRVFSELLNPFVVQPKSSILYENSESFIESEIGESSGGIIKKSLITSPWKKKVVAGVNHGANNSEYELDPIFVEHLVCMHRATAFQSTRKAAALAKSIQMQLLQGLPERRYVISYFRPEDFKVPSLKTSPTRPVFAETVRAIICIRRAIDVSSLNVGLYVLPTPLPPSMDIVSEIHNTRFIFSPQVSNAFITSIPFATRLKIYVDLLKMHSDPQMNPTISFLRSSIISDIVSEQAVLRVFKNASGMTKISAGNRLQKLKLICEIQLSKTEISSPVLPAVQSKMTLMKRRQRSESIPKITATSELSKKSISHFIQMLIVIDATAAAQIPWISMVAGRAKLVSEATTEMIKEFVLQILDANAVTTIQQGVKQLLKIWKTKVKGTTEDLPTIAFRNALGAFIAPGKLQVSVNDDVELTKGIPTSADESSSDPLGDALDFKSIFVQADISQSLATELCMLYDPCLLENAFLAAVNGRENPYVTPIVLDGDADKMGGVMEEVAVRNFQDVGIKRVGNILYKNQRNIAKSSRFAT